MDTIGQMRYLRLRQEKDAPGTYTFGPFVIISDMSKRELAYMLYRHVRADAELQRDLDVVGGDFWIV